MERFQKGRGFRVQGSGFRVQGSGFRVVVAASLQYIWGDARRSAESRFPVWNFQTLTARPRMTKISRFARNDDTKSRFAELAY